MKILCSLSLFFIAVNPAQAALKAAAQTTQSLLIAATSKQRKPANALCEKIKPETLNASVDQFLNKKGLWYVNAISANVDVCFLILSGSKKSLSSNIEILVYNPTSKTINRVEDVFPVPQSLRVGIGRLWNLQKDGTSQPNQNLFYGELKERSALEAFKSIISGKPFSGLVNSCVEIAFSGDKLAPTGKLSWDPTPGRTWKLSEMQYSLGRGLTPEVYDIYSDQLDENFVGFLKGSAPCANGSQPRGAVGSWNSSIVEVWSEGKWTRVTYDAKLGGAAPPTQEVYSHEVSFKSGEEEDCLKALEKLNVHTALLPVRSIPVMPASYAQVKFRDPRQKSLAKVKALACVEAIIEL